MTISDLEPQPATVLQLEPNCNDNKSTTNSHQTDNKAALSALEDDHYQIDFSSNRSTTSSLSSFNDAISVDSAIHCNSISSDQGSIVGDKPTCRICLCTNDEIDDDGNSVVSVKITKKNLNKIKKTNNNLKTPKCSDTKSPFNNFDPNDPHILVTPCYCSGTLEFVHHKCLQQWIRTSSRQYCDMCRYHFKLHIKNKPFYTVSIFLILAIF